jgi:rhamnopyranosyl-N-acetylglucosaminyl-diphospho-decaprenol beta-1,3/1,4-galactofuranosyltransferase
MRKVGLLEVPRFTWYFLVTKRSPRQFVQWVRLVRQGRAERFHRA